MSGNCKALCQDAPSTTLNTAGALHGDSGPEPARPVPSRLVRLLFSPSFFPLHRYSLKAYSMLLLQQIPSPKNRIYLVASVSN